VASRSPPLSRNLLAGRLPLCLPWLLCYLRPLQEDPVSRALPPYRAALATLRALAGSAALLAPLQPRDGEPGDAPAAAPAAAAWSETPPAARFGARARLCYR